MSRPHLALLSVALLLSPSTAHAAASVWPATPGYLLISSPIGSSYFRQDAVIPDGAGGGFVGWDEYFGTIKVQHKLASGLIGTGWVNSGSVACASSVGGSRSYVSLARDAGSGVYVAWVDTRPGDIADVYLQHLLGDGTADPGWPSNGVRVTNVPSLYDYYCTTLSDGAGGVYVCWIANDMSLNTFTQRVTRLTSAGAFAFGWSSTGVALHTAANSMWPAALASDGANGVLAAFTTGSQLRVQRVLANGTQDAAHWPADGSIVSSNVVINNYAAPELVSRLSGEAFLVWSDTRFGQSDEYALRLTPNGISAGWPATGMSVANTIGDESDISATPDGTGGVLVAWLDHGANSLMAHRVRADGTLDPVWPSAGRVLTPWQWFGGDHLSVAPAASDGMLVLGLRYDSISGNFEVVASRVRANGTIPAEWAAGPAVMYQAPGSTPTLRAVPDGNDGAIGFFILNLFGGLSEVGQRVRWNGTLGMVSIPRVASVRDVGPDQGGKVRVFCNSPEGDTLPNNAVASYALWRQITASSAQAKIARGATVAGHGSDAEALPGALREARTASGTQLYWEYLGSWPSRGVSGYSQLVTTASDSLPGSIPWETFVIDALDAGGAILATSPPDSGYSVDNLSPAAPTPFLAAYSGGATHLHWAPNAEADYHHFVLHRGAEAAFVPGPATLIATLSDTGYVDPGAAGSYYKLAAVDVHGNAGAWALVTPGLTTDVTAGELTLDFARLSPNPARGEALLSFTLPHAGDVELSVFDVSGRCARVIARGPRGAGAFTERWDGTDANRRALPNGVYLARLTFAGRSLVQRFSLIR